MSHETYQSHVKTKRAEVIQFRNDLINRFTNPLAKLKKTKEDARKSSTANELFTHQMKSQPQIVQYP